MIKAIHFTLLITTFPFLLLAQSSKIDSLTKVVDVLPSDTTKVNALNNLVYELSYGNKDNALAKASEAMELAKSLGFEQGVADVNDLIGIIHLDKGSLDSAQSFFLASLKYYESNRLKSKMFTSYQKLAQVHSLRNSFDKARFYVEKEISIAREIGDAKMIGNSFNDYAAFYINQGWNLLDNEHDSINYLGFFKKALPYIDSAISQFEIAKYHKGTALAFGNLSILSEEMGDFDLALEHILKATEYFEKMNYKIYIVSAYNQTNRVYQRLGKYDSALIYVERSLKLATEIESKFDMRNAYGQFNYLHQELGNFKKALEYHSKYDDLNNQILAEKKQASIDELEVKYESEKRQQELLIQETKNENQRTTIILILIGGFGLLIAVITFWFKNKKEHRLNVLLEQNNLLITKQNAKLEESYQQQNNLMAVVAHDLRAPLNNVKGLMDILQMSDPLSEEQREISDKATHVAENGLELITDIMSLSKFRNGIEAEIETYKVNDLLGEIVDSHSSYSRRKDISLRFDPVKNDPEIHTDKVFFTRIMDNLISNAVKFSPYRSETEIACIVSTDQFAVSVSDSGPGMSKEDLKYVFKRFKRLSARPTGGENSNGLGLSIVKTLVDKLKGKVEIEMNATGGTKFTITLPFIE